MTTEEEVVLPFDVEIEQLPRWVHALSAAVLVVGIGVALHLVPMVAFLPFLILSSLGRRLASSARKIEISHHGLRSVDRRPIDVAANDIRDVWLDEEEPRVVVAHGDYSDLLIMTFENREQAARCARELDQARGEVGRVRAIVGFRPRPMDALPSLRFLALAIAFFGTGAGWISAAILALFLLNAFFVVSARQIVVVEGGWISRSLFGEREMKTPSDTTTESPEISRTSLRDPLLASPLWLTRARDRALREMQKRATD